VVAYLDVRCEVDKIARTREEGERGERKKDEIHFQPLILLISY
jgi:hypothetical protein